MRRLLLTGLLMLASCSPKVQVETALQGPDRATMLADNWAVGPVVLDPRLQLDGVADLEVRRLGGTWEGLSEQYAPGIFFALLEQRPELKLAPYTAVSGNLETATLAALAEPLARKNELPTGVLQAIGEGLPDTHFLVTARIEATRIINHVSDPDPDSPIRRKDADGLAVEERTVTAKVIRRATVRLQVHDLQEGTLVWEGLGEGVRQELYNWKRPLESPGVEVEREGEEPLRIDLAGSPLRAPSLESALKPAFEDLAEVLLK